VGQGGPGRLVDIGGFRLHLNCAGRGSPTVVFDAALGGSSLSWWFVQPEVARFTQACAYDRAGFGWSEAGPMPRTAGRIASELRALLDKSNIAPPYLLVGHSFGALVMRIFAGRHNDDVCGLVLVEPAFPEDWIEPNDHERRRIDLGVRLCRYGQRASRLGVSQVVAALAGLGALTPARWLAALAGRGALQPEHEQILAPMWKLPPEARAQLRRLWTRPEFFAALSSQIESIRTSASETLDAPALDPDLPLVIVSATDPHPHHVMMQGRLARLSSRGTRIVAPSSGHWVPLDAPASVTGAIRSLFEGLSGPT
jgi:pimeloyl-ACP methyl ester carboxylesterase